MESLAIIRARVFKYSWELEFQTQNKGTKMLQIENQRNTNVKLFRNENTVYNKKFSLKSQ